MENLLRLNGIIVEDNHYIKSAIEKILKDSEEIEINIINIFSDINSSQFFIQIKKANFLLININLPNLTEDFLISAKKINKDIKIILYSFEDYFNKNISKNADKIIQQDLIYETLIPTIKKLFQYNNRGKK